MACSNCSSTITTDCTCDECVSCPVLLDTSCVIYHKDNSEVSELDILDLTNGATLELILETIDEKLSAADVPSYTLPYLRSLYSINTLQQFAQGVDAQLSATKTQLDLVGASVNTALTAVDTSTINFSTSGTLGHTLTGSVKTSSTAGNRVSIVADGLLVVAQTLSINNTTKELTIVGGNSVSLAALASGVSGWLGNVVADPTALDGQYWWNTTANAGAGALKIKVNGVVKTITTT